VLDQGVGCSSLPLMLPFAYYCRYLVMANLVVELVC